MTVYAEEADTFERDPIVTPGAHGRADVASGPHWRALRFMSIDNFVERENPYGEMHWMSVKCDRVLTVAVRLERTGVRVTQRSIGALLGIAPSTVSRFLVKLQAWGFIVYDSARGRYGGTLFLVREYGDKLDHMRGEAKARLRAWWKAREARISRLISNVASYFPGREGELYEHRYSTDTVTVTGRNIKTEYAPWTPDDFREAGLM